MMNKYDLKIINKSRKLNCSKILYKNKWRLKLIKQMLVNKMKKRNKRKSMMIVNSNGNKD